MESSDKELNGPVKKKLQKKYWWLIGAIVLVLLAVASYFLFFRNNDQAPAAEAPATEQSAQLNAPQLKLTQFATGLASTTGIISTKQTDDSRLFVVSRDGVIKIVGADGQVSPQPFLDIRSKVTASGEMGLLGLAFSPKFSSDKTFYVNYIDKSQNTIIAKYSASSDSAADAGSERILLTLKQPYPNHNGGDLVFGPDGYLYATLGDGGSQGDPSNRAQNTNNLFGKILRLDVSTVPYKIPADNPFVGQSGKMAEIWAYGLRNPWRISFDRKTNDLFIADVGQGKLEEVNVQKAGSKGGVNYGWRCYEASQPYNTNGCTDRTNYAVPDIEYDHGNGRCSITGGYVYRGSKFPALEGKYIYGDYCNGEVYWASQQDNKWQGTTALKSSYKISVFGEDNKGELYLADFAGGTIYRIEDGANKAQ